MCLGGNARPGRDSEQVDQAAGAPLVSHRRPQAPSGHRSPAAMTAIRAVGISACGLRVPLAMCQQPARRGAPVAQAHPDDQRRPGQGVYGLLSDRVLWLSRYTLALCEFSLLWLSVRLLSS